MDSIRTVSLYICAQRLVCRVVVNFSPFFQVENMHVSISYLVTIFMGIRCENNSSYFSV